MEFERFNQYVQQPIQEIRAIPQLSPKERQIELDKIDADWKGAHILDENGNYAKWVGMPAPY